MKNFKKVLALVLVVATLLSFATVAGAISASSYTDSDKITRTEAVDVLSGIGVLNGYGDGSFKPAQTITRAEAAKIIAMFDNGSTDINKLYTSANPFTDAKANWAESYIAYCYNVGIIGGVGNNKFAPASNVTGAQYLKMVLCVLGYNAKDEKLEGTSWAVNTLAIAKKAGLLKGFSTSFDWSAELCREDAAQIMLNALKADVVEYGYAVKDSNKYYTVAGAVSTGKTLAETDWSLTLVSDTSDKWGRPGHAWYQYKNGKATDTKKYGVYTDTPDATYYASARKCDILDEIGDDYKNDLFNTYTNGNKNLIKEDVKLTDTTDSIGAQGRQMEVYADAGIIVYIDTYLAEVVKVIAEKKDSNGHITTEASVDAEVYGLTEGALKSTKLNYETSKFAKGDMVLVTVCNGDIASMAVATAKDGKLTKQSGIDIKTAIKGIKTVGGADVTINCTADYTLGLTAAAAYVAASNSNPLDLGTVYTFYYDAHDNIIGVSGVSSTYVVIDSLHKDTSARDDVLIANLVGMDAKMLEKVTVVEIEDNDTATNDEIAGFSTDPDRNTEWYHDLYTYVVNADGNYELTRADVDGDNDGAWYTKGDKYISTDGKTIELSSTTQILLQTKDSKDGTFAAFVGYEELPNFAASEIEVVYGTNGYAAIVYVRGTTLNLNTVFVYTLKESDMTTEYVKNHVYTCSIPVLKFNEETKALDKVWITAGYGTDKDAAIRMALSEFDTVGLYEAALNSADGVEYYDAFSIYDLKDIVDFGATNERAYVNNFFNPYSSDERVELDGATFFRFYGDNDYATELEDVKSVSEDTKTTYTADDLEKGSLIFVQYGKDSKGNVDFDTIVAVYDMYLPVEISFAAAHATAKAETKAPEYLNHAFNTITVTGLKDWEEVKSAKNGNLDADITSTTVADSSFVAGKIVITLGLKDHANDQEFVANTYALRGANQKLVIDNAKHTITVYTNGQTVNVEDVNTVLQAVPAKVIAQQTVSTIFNTSGATVAAGEIKNDYYLTVDAWNTDLVDAPVQYNFVVDATVAE